jgi:hypothetical protein
MLSKICTKCGIDKPITAFASRKERPNGLGVRSKCKECSNEICRSRCDKNPSVSRERNLQTLYGITHNDYLKMLEAQNGRCAICGTDTPGGRGAFHVDHCHDSGNIRGLLCHHCNTGLGHFKDQESLLLKAALYLHNHRDHTTPSH